MQHLAYRAIPGLKQHLLVKILGNLLLRIERIDPVESRSLDRPLVTAEQQHNPGLIGLNDHEAQRAEQINYNTQNNNADPGTRPDSLRKNYD